MKILNKTIYKGDIFLSKKEYSPELLLGRVNNENFIVLIGKKKFLFNTIFVYMKSRYINGTLVKYIEDNCGHKFFVNIGYEENMKFDGNDVFLTYYTKVGTICDYEEKKLEPIQHYHNHYMIDSMYRFLFEEIAIKNIDILKFIFSKEKYARLIKRYNKQAYEIL